MTPGAYAAYDRVAAVTTSKDRILIMLYEGALRFLKNAGQGIKDKQIAAKGENISKVIAILSELECALDHKVGGELAENLASLYHYMNHRLVEANIKNDPDMLDEVGNLLAELKDAFEQAAQMNKASIPTQSRYPTAAVTGRVSFAV